MTAIEPESVPGGFQSGRDALNALVENAQTQGVLRDALTRANHMVASLVSLLNELECERKDALRAIDLFADIAPASLGAYVSVTPTEGMVEVETGLSAIEQAVKELLDARAES
jgi:hypothetical protein